MRTPGFFEDYTLDKINTWFIYAGLCIAGFMASAGLELANGQPPRPSVLLGRFFVSGFAGALAGVYGTYQEWSPMVLAMVGGICGFSGVTIVQLVEKQVLKRFFPDESIK